MEKEPKVEGSLRVSLHHRTDEKILQFTPGKENLAEYVSMHTTVERRKGQFLLKLLSTHRSSIYYEYVGTPLSIDLVRHFSLTEKIDLLIEIATFLGNLNESHRNLALRHFVRGSHDKKLRIFGFRNSRSNPLSNDIWGLGKLIYDCFKGSLDRYLAKLTPEYLEKALSPCLNTLSAPNKVKRLIFEMLINPANLNFAKVIQVLQEFKDSDYLDDYNCPWVKELEQVRLFRGPEFNYVPKIPQQLELFCTHTVAIKEVSQTIRKALSENLTDDKLIQVSVCKQCPGGFLQEEQYLTLDVEAQAPALFTHVLQGGHFSCPEHKCYLGNILDVNQNPSILFCEECRSPICSFCGSKTETEPCAQFAYLKEHPY